MWPLLDNFFELLQLCGSKNKKKKKNNKNSSGLETLHAQGKKEYRIFPIKTPWGTKFSDHWEGGVLLESGVLIGSGALEKKL